MGIKNYHIQKQSLLFYIILYFLFLSHLNTINTSKSGNHNLLNSLFSKRKLDELLQSTNNNEKIYESDQICSSISEELMHYYSTGDLLKLDLDKNLLDSTGSTETLASFAENKIYKDSYYSYDTEYGKLTIDIQEILSHFKCVILFLIISIISFICWFVCCCNACCNCCCCKCCCCKQQCCFITILILYLIVIAICIYGYINIKNTIEGIYDTQCSYLYFFESILYGEKKEAKPKWVGIEEIKNILNNLKNKLYYIINNDNYLSNLNQYKYAFDLEKSNFFLLIKNVHKKFYKKDEITPKDGYCIDYPDSNEYFFQNNIKTLYLKNKYILDIIPLFGKYHTNNQSFSGYISLWNKEFSENNAGASNAMDNFRINLENLILSGYYFNELDNGIKKLDNLKTPLENIYKKRMKSLNKFNKIFGNKIEIILWIIFGVLLSSSLSLYILLFLFYKRICDCTCLCKFFIHFLWNILAISMVISLIFGSACFFVNILGNEMISIFSHIVSTENFSDDNPFVLDIFKESKDILEECFLREGNLTKNFNLEELRHNLNNIIESKKEIKKYIEIFNEISINHPSYNFLKSILDNKTEFINDTYIYHYNSLSQIDNDIIEKIKLDDAIKLLNDSIGNSFDEKWDKHYGDKTLICSEGVFDDFSISKDKEHLLLNPWSCEPIDRDWILVHSNKDTQNYAKIVSDIIDLLKYANSTKNPGINGFENYYQIINGLKDDYDNYLKSEINILESYGKKDFELIDILEKGIGKNSNDSFSFMNGKFIKQNFNILLNNLKNTFGKDLYILCICFISIGISLILAIPSTLLLLSLFNEKNKTPILIPKIHEKNVDITNDDEYTRPIIEEKYNNEYIKESYDAKTIKAKIRLLTNEIKVKKYKINLIFFYEKMTNENINIYNRMKLEILGGFFGVQKLDILIKLFEKLKEENTSFILISTGSSFEKIKELCNNYDFIKYIIIFCIDIVKYEELYNSKGKVKLITNDISKINNYLDNLSELYHDYDKNIKKLISRNPLISYYEYKNYYYIFHKILSFFFKEDYSILNYREDYKNVMFKFIRKNSGCNEVQKKELENIITNIYNSNTPLKEFLEFYTDENE